MSIIVIRVESKNGIGMFRQDSSYERAPISVIMRHAESFNTPSEDGLSLNLFSKNWFCAYKSLEQISNWILTKEEFHYLIGRGFRIYALTVEEFQVGKHQVVFTKESIVKKLDITELFL